MVEYVVFLGRVWKALQQFGEKERQLCNLRSDGFTLQKMTAGENVSWSCVSTTDHQRCQLKDALPWKNRKEVEEEGSKAMEKKEISWTSKRLSEFAGFNLTPHCMRLVIQERCSSSLTVLCCGDNINYRVTSSAHTNSCTCLLYFWFLAIVACCHFSNSHIIHSVNHSPNVSHAGWEWSEAEEITGSRKWICLATCRRNLPIRLTNDVNVVCALLISRECRRIVFHRCSVFRCSLCCHFVTIPKSRIQFLCVQIWRISVISVPYFVMHIRTLNESLENGRGIAFSYLLFCFIIKLTGRREYSMKFVRDLFWIRICQSDQ